MKRLLLRLCIPTMLLLGSYTLHAAVTYKLTFNSVTQVYTVSFNSTVAYSGGLARITPSTQITLVAPDPDGTGAGVFSISNLTSLTALNWGHTQLNSPAQNTSADYLFFAPSNAGTYAPFNIPANTDIDLFSFKAAAPCSGTLYLYDNINDPLNANGSINGDNNFRVLGGGNVNLYTGNSSGPVPCPPCPINNISVVTTQVSCFGGNNGSATVIAADGIPPYAYAWPASAGNQTTQTVNNLQAGNYTVTVTDAGGCTGTITVAIQQPTLLGVNASITATISCFGGHTGAISASASGGTTPYIYLWSNGSADPAQSGLSAGTYTVTVTDAKGCTTSSALVLIQPALLTANIPSSLAPACAGGANGSATAAGGGGTAPYTYAWSNANAGAINTGLMAGTYTVTVTDAQNCTATASVTLSNPPALTAVVSAQTNVLCAGSATGSATINASGGTPLITYLWPVAAASQTTATASNLAAGTYTATVTDGQGCTLTVSATITEPKLPLHVTIAGTNVACGATNNGSAVASVTGGSPGYTYLWSSGATTPTALNLSVGTYTVTITDQVGCTKTNSVAIGQNSGSVNYKLTLDPDGQTYRVWFNSSIGYTGPLARISGSTQFTLVFPDPDGTGAGAVQLTNIVSLTDLDFSHTQLNSPLQSPGKDYAFFAPTAF
jgi:hypothetical protein